jgi:acyl carrier protein
MAETPSDAIFDYLSKQYGISRDEIDGQSLLFSDGYLDSFSMVELVSWLEQRFAVRFGVLDINLGNLDSVERMSNYVASKGA